MRSLTSLTTLTRSASWILRSTPQCKPPFEHSLPLSASILPQCQGFSTLQRQTLLRCSTKSAWSKLSCSLPQLPTKGTFQFLGNTKQLAGLKTQADEIRALVAIRENATEVEGFAKSEKATKAAQVNLSARLRKEGPNVSGTAGFGEITRLVKIARREAKWLSGMVHPTDFLIAFKYRV